MEGGSGEAERGEVASGYLFEYGELTGTCPECGAPPAHHPNEAMQDAIRLLETAKAKNWKAVIEETLEILKSAAVPA